MVNESIDIMNKSFLKFWGDVNQEVKKILICGMFCYLEALHNVDIQRNYLKNRKHFYSQFNQFLITQ